MNAINLTHKYIASQRKYQNFQKLNEIETMLNKIMNRLFDVPKNDDMHLNKQLLTQLPNHLKKDMGLIDKDINNHLPRKGENPEAIKYGQLWI